MNRTERQTGPVERFRATLELIQVGVSLMRQNIRRRHPGLDDEAVENRLREWLWRHPVEAPRDPALRLVGGSRFR